MMLNGLIKLERGEFFLGDQDPDPQNQGWRRYKELLQGFSEHREEMIIISLLFGMK